MSTPTADSPNAPVFGVLGGIASGKSRVASILAGADGVVINADELAHEVLASDEVT
ncbi:MAG: dephospho-CoA kinase, partial [Planctomycetes bacterium]|nr:dephospho-CoA kinase [Planctomycetota bacterium]